MQHVTPSVSWPQYKHLKTHFDTDRRTVWYYMNASPRPSFTTELLAEIRDFQSKTAAFLNEHATSSVPPLTYAVLASQVPGVFNLGGDLELFEELIRSGDRTGLTAYAKLCIDAVWHNANALGSNTLTTISLVQGTALGGGFEAALSSDIVIAEKSARMAFPEIIFNLFPGMGAYHLLARRLSPAHTKQFMRNIKQYTADDLCEMGVIDMVVADGTGVAAVTNYIKNNDRRRIGLQAIENVHRQMHPVGYDSLTTVIQKWVDAAMQLTTRDLKMMGRLTSEQYRMSARSTHHNVTEPRYNIADEVEHKTAVTMS